MTAFDLYFAMPEDAKRCVEEATREGVKFADAVSATAQILAITDKPAFETLRSKVQRNEQHKRPTCIVGCDRYPERHLGPCQMQTIPF